MSSLTCWAQRFCCFNPSAMENEEPTKKGETEVKAPDNESVKKGKGGENTEVCRAAPGSRVKRAAARAPPPPPPEPRPHFLPPLAGRLLKAADVKTDGHL
ncbi:hypothetical protein H8959_022765 [Pygathrix nigripes]